MPQIEFPLLELADEMTRARKRRTRRRREEEEAINSKFFTFAAAAAAAVAAAAVAATAVTPQAPKGSGDLVLLHLLPLLNFKASMYCTTRYASHLSWT